VKPDPGYEIPLFSAERFFCNVKDKDLISEHSTCPDCFASCLSTAFKGKDSPI
jgi:hypothetical protein